MSGRARLVRVLGVDVVVHPGWAIAFAFITAALVVIGLPTGGPGPASPISWVLAAAGAALLFASVLAHELVHALVARRLGLAPRPVSLFLSAGGAGSLDRVGSRPTDELLVAASGPLASVGLAGIFGGLALTLDNAGGAPVALVDLCLLGAVMNGVLGLFNVVPAFPLDGGRILRAILWGLRGDLVAATRATAGVSRAIGWVAMGAGIAIAVLNDAVTGLTIVILGWFVSRFATSAYRWAAIERQVAGLSVGQVMERDAPTVRPNLTLDVFVEQYLTAGAGSGFAVTIGDELNGTIDVDQARRVPRSRWPERRIADVMVPRPAVETAREDEPLWPVIQRFERERLHVMPVLEGDRLIGVLTREGLLATIRRRARLSEA